jgi:ATP-grasp domain
MRLVSSKGFNVNTPMDFPLDSTKEFEPPARPVILLAATLWWQLSARLAIRFLEYGCRVSAVCPEGHPLRHVRGLQSYFPYRRLNSRSSLEHAIRRATPDIIIPCDDRAVLQLHELHRLRPDLRPLIEVSLGAPEGFEQIEHRDLLLADAQALGICIPATKRITSEEQVHDWFAQGERSAVLKLDGTWGGEGVMIAHSEEEAREAFRRLAQPPRIAIDMKRFLVNRDPLHLSRGSKQAAPSIVVQQMIEGWPANSMVACWQGEVLSMVSVEVLASQGTTGAAFLVRLIESDEMTRAARLLAKKLKLNGFFGLDFQVDRVTGRPYLLELNPRCTQLGHLPVAGGADLAGALCAKRFGAVCETHEASVEGRVVAFFPQAGHWKYLFPKEVYDDIPKGQPELVDELSRRSWPERQWISRIYHLFRPARAVEPVTFWSESEERGPMPPSSYESGADLQTIGNASK